MTWCNVRYRHTKNDLDCFGTRYGYSLDPYYIRRIVRDSATRPYRIYAQRKQQDQVLQVEHLFTRTCRRGQWWFYSRQFYVTIHPNWTKHFWRLNGHLILLKSTWKKNTRNRVWQLLVAYNERVNYKESTVFGCRETLRSQKRQMRQINDEQEQRRGVIGKLWKQLHFREFNCWVAWSCPT